MDSVPGGSRDQFVYYTRKEIFLILQNCLSDDFNAQIEHLQTELSITNNCSIVIRPETKSVLSTLFCKLRTKWQAASRKLDYFFRKNEEWLSITITFPICVATPRIKKGRPSLVFSSCSDRTKRRKTEEMRKQYTVEELSYGTQMSLRTEGKIDAAVIIKDVTLSPTTKSSKYREALKAKVESTISCDEALSIMVEAKLTRSQYNIIRSSMKKNNCKLYPKYETLRQAKLRCYPPRFAITVTEKSAEVNLQALLDHTCERILAVQTEVIQTLTQQNLSEVILIFKWGCDGSSGQSEYKQQFSNEDDTDASVFVTSLVPLQLIGTDSVTIIWKNPKPSSPRFCRPIRLQFISESVDISVKEMKYIEDQISSLVPFTTVVNGKEITVKYKMLLTMIDGKVCNALTSTKSTQKCYLCGATSKQFNNIDEIIQLKIEDKNLRFGLSTLHAWIRLFECLLHLSYKLDVKKWQIRDKKDKEIVAERKANIQKKFKLQLGILVDRPKPGYGSSNDGNTARRFFENATISASITGVDETIIKRFHSILQTISSEYSINVVEFEKYALETARLFVALYPWYFMPTTVHKLLIHGPQIIQSALLPIGQLSEEAQEARNKDFKKYREGFARKCSREKTMEDVLHWLLISSDPLISSLRKLSKKKSHHFSSDALKLLQCPNITPLHELDTEDSNSDTD